MLEKGNLTPDDLMLRELLEIIIILNRTQGKHLSTVKENASMPVETVPGWTTTCRYLVISLCDSLPVKRKLLIPLWLCKSVPLSALARNS